MSDENLVQVNFGGSTGGFAATVEEVKSKLEDIGAPVDMLSEKLMKLGEVVAEAFAAEKIKEFVEATAEAAVRISSLSQVSGLSTDTIQTLQFAMEMTGGNAEAAGLMITRFERAVYEAAAGSGAAYNDFQKLGISLKDLRTSSPEQLFKEALDGFKNVGDASERAEIQTQLFSRAGQRLGPVLVQGSAGFEEMREQLDETSEKMNAARTNEMSAMYGDILKMKDAWVGLGESLLISVAPAIEDILIWLKALAEDLNKVYMTLELAIQGFLLFTHLQSKAQTQANVKLIANPQDQSNAAGGEKNRNEEAQAKESQEIAMQGFEDKARLYSEDVSKYKAEQALLVAQGKETADQEIKNEIRAVEAERDLQMTNLDQMIAINGQNAKEHQKLLDEKLIMSEKFETQIIALQTKEVSAQQEAIKKQEKQWDEGIHSMTSMMDTFVRSTLTGTQTVGQAFQKMAQTMVLNFITAIIRIIAENALLMAAQSQGWTVFAASLKKDLGDWVMTETAKTGATTTGVAARTAAQTAGATEGKIAETANASESILKSAGTAAAAVYADVAEIPVVGWILAPIAAAAAFAGVMAFDSFDKGTDYVPHDMLAQIHKGEMIVPERHAAQIRSGISGADSFSGGGLGGGDSHMHFHVSAMDSKDVSKFFNKHGKEMANTMRQHLQSGGSRATLART